MHFRNGGRAQVRDHNNRKSWSVVGDSLLSMPPQGALVQAEAVSLAVRHPTTTTSEDTAPAPVPAPTLRSKRRELPPHSQRHRDNQIVVLSLPHKLNVPAFADDALKGLELP